MEKAELFPHNEQAFQLLIVDLKSHKCTTINHATGTGKSFIALKFLYENRDKKYLYIAPTYPIIEQLFADCSKIGLTPEDINVDTMIYRTLLGLDMKELFKKYDGIIFDEYHRVGARETYKKIKELKLLLQESDGDEVFIGLTATPKRYLDHERDMTQEVFDGNVASSISLSQAMLERLLPVPIYINSKIACRGELIKTSKKVARLSPSKEKKELEKRLVPIGKKINNGNLDVKQMIGKYITEKNGKFIIFCSTVNALEQTYKEVDEWFSAFGKIKKYKVYSDQRDDENRRLGLKQRNSRAVNQANLDAFNNEKEGISVLLCIDILNEGVHVDGVDGVFLLRKTVSPIIYFQQIGRALSFSARNKQIKIFDLVNNFGNHNAIDAVYREFREEMERMIASHPEKAEEYRSILARFKIMDETREILKELNAISKEVTPKKIIASKINYAIRILKNAALEEESDINMLSDVDVNNAFATISKYHKYVDNEQFKQLTSLDILLPESLSMSYEERQELLEGFDSIKELEEAESDICIDDFIQFVTENGRRPELNSEEVEERRLCQRYLVCLPDFKDSQKVKLREFIDANNIECTSWEKVLLGKSVSAGDVEDIIELSRRLLGDNQLLPEYIQRAITSITINYNIRQNQELFLILEQNEKIEQEYIKQRQQERLQRLLELVDALDKNKSSTRQELKEKGILDEILRLTPADEAYVVQKYSAIKRRQYREIISGKEDDDLMVFCRRMRNVTPEAVGGMLSSVEQEKKKNETLRVIMDFMIKNNGELPKKESENEHERELAKQLETYIESGMVLPTIVDLEKDMENRWYSPEEIALSVVAEGIKESDIKIAILNNISFFNRNGRRALKNSQDEEERRIALEYEEKCVNGMSQDKIAVLNKVFNNKTSLNKACMAYINNILQSQKEKEEGDQYDV